MSMALSVFIHLLPLFGLALFIIVGSTLCIRTARFLVRSAIRALRPQRRTRQYRVIVTVRR
jgi:hypothetical protein